MSNEVSFYNNSGEAIPPWAVMQVEGGHSVVSRTIIKVRKPDTDLEHAGYLLNGPTEIPINSTGSGYTGFKPRWARYDSGSTPTTGEEWGPVTDSWEISSDGDGFTIIGGEDETKVLVRRLIGGGGEGDIFFKPVSIAPDFGFSCDAVIATVVRAPCNSSVQVGDEVIVVDSTPNFALNPNGYFRMPDDILFTSAYGWAQKMKTFEAERYELGLGKCVYIVKSMLCVEPVVYE